MLKEIMEQATVLDGMLRQYQEEHPFSSDGGKFIHNITINDEGIDVFMQPSKFLEVCEGCKITMNLSDEHQCVFVNARMLRFKYSAIFDRSDMTKYLVDRDYDPTTLEQYTLEDLYGAWRDRFLQDMEGEDETSECR